jgi:hypothetical protein
MKTIEAIIKIILVGLTLFLVSCNYKDFPMKEQTNHTVIIKLE